MKKGRVRGKYSSEGWKERGRERERETQRGRGRESYTERERYEGGVEREGEREGKIGVWGGERGERGTFNLPYETGQKQI